MNTAAMRLNKSSSPPRFSSAWARSKGCRAGLFIVQSVARTAATRRGRHILTDSESARGRVAMKRISKAAVTACAMLAGSALADGDILGRNMAASCATCHGTNGRSVGGMAVLAGYDPEKFYAVMTLGPKETETENAKAPANVRYIFFSEFVKDVEKNEKAEIKVNSYNETSVPAIFAAGDVTDVPEKQIIIAAGEGSKAALSAFRYLSRTRW